MTEQRRPGSHVSGSGGARETRRETEPSESQPPDPNTANAGSDAAAGPVTLRVILTRHVPVLFALSCAAIGMPLLDLYGNNPTIFVTAEFTRQNIIMFALLVALGPGVLATLAELTTWILYRRAVVVVHAVLVGGFSALVGLVIARKVAPDLSLAALGAAIVLGLAIPILEHRASIARTWMQYMAALPVVVLLLFFFASPTSDLLADTSASFAAPSSLDDPPPVVFLIFDELPVVSLMDEDGDVRGDLFPNFAALADTSHWYRNAVTQAMNTEGSVPSLLSGTEPKIGSAPISAAWPRNLFTLLGRDYEVVAREVTTQLCPGELCEATPAPYASFFNDASVVYAHLTLPSMWRDSLPRIDETWGDFGDVNPFNDGRKPADGKLGSASNRIADLEEVTDEFDGSVTRPRLYYAHAALPHKAWTSTPEGREVASARVESGRFESGDQPEPVNSWVDDLVSRFWFQRYLHQMGNTDRVLGEIRHELEREGIWNEALVIATSDHGAAWGKGIQHRGWNPDNNFDWLFRVPLFVKEPGQTASQVIDDPTQLIDVLPTIVEVLQKDTDWDFDGSSLLAHEPLTARFAWGGNANNQIREELPLSVESLFETAREKESWLGDGDGWLSVVAVGEYGEYVGQRTAAIDLDLVEDAPVQVDQEEILSEVDLEHGKVPVVLSGDIHLEGWSGGRELLLAVNGTVAGIAILRGDRPDYRFQGVIDEGFLRDGDNPIEILVPAPPP